MILVMDPESEVQRFGIPNPDTDPVKCVSLFWTSKISLAVMIVRK